MIRRLRRMAGSDALSGRLARYVLVGGSAAIVDLGGFVAFSVAGLGVLPAAALSFCCAAVFNFILSAQVAFRQEPTWRRAGLFAALALIGLAVNAGVTTLAAHHLPALLAKIVGIGAAFALNFGMNNAVVFRR